MFIFTLFVQTLFTLLEKSNSYLLIFTPIKDILDVYNLEHPSQMFTILKFPEILTISPHFDHTFLHISRHLRVFAS